MDQQFQSTRPRGARPLVFDAADKRLCVSIHAPAWGATSATQPISPKAMFQSTRPRGARHDALANLQQHRQVSIHAPAWGATSVRVASGVEAEVSIHAPAWGATAQEVQDRCRTMFQSTRPRGARRRLRSVLKTIGKIIDFGEPRKCRASSDLRFGARKVRNRETVPMRQRCEPPGVSPAA